ncbi:hypothetical protein [Stratiformator vulcanicus]|uniref:Uncharacterized protein n=1 Tax=Stratiformator vulcanicus TaxID=2527980 RepID=A0A517R2V4_9PLAN|nr:hypothetical protein [Stratiformator vulcanicus]QDT38209.1 hypothetical protein Pan189_25990 [Stratiformator vulcanicus]
MSVDNGKHDGDERFSGHSDDESEISEDALLTERKLSNRPPVPVRALLWVLAFAMAATAMIYQRATGPTRPYKDQAEIRDKTNRVKLIRTWEIPPEGAKEDWTEAAKIEVPNPPGRVSSTLHQRRYRTDEEFRETPMRPGSGKESNTLFGQLEPQPAAGKMEYYVTLEGIDWEQRMVRYPTDPDETIVLRYKNFVPRYVLAPHIIFMILTILFGMRAGLSGLFDPGAMRKYAWTTFICMTIGGMILGPFVQKFAFGEYWTGFPFGGDWTDNKQLVNWLVWLIACAAIGFKPLPKEWIGRVLVVIAMLTMTAVYSIPHSMGGSELDYEAIEQGADPEDAVTTGRT